MSTTGNIHNPPSRYNPPIVSSAQMIWDCDVMVPMRDGVHLCIDIYRPAESSTEKFPALLAIAPHNKDLQNQVVANAVPPQPAWSTVWQGGAEAGDSAYLVSRGYVHVVGNPRGFGKSEDGASGQSAHWDFYDLIEWIAVQPWCSGKVGMIGLSAFAMSQWQAAMLQPPSLKAIFPYDAMAAYGAIHDRFPGGVIHLMLYLLEVQSVHHGGHERPGELTPELEQLWQAALNNPDYQMYTPLYNLLTQKGQIHTRSFHQLLDPYEKPGNYDKSEADFKKIKVPAYTGAGWHAYTYKMHLQGAQNWYAGIDVPKKLMFTGVRHMERPWHALHEEIVRWYDYWLKGIDTGIMAEPPVKYWVHGANQWRTGSAWPLPETQWTKFYLHSWERLRAESFDVHGGDRGYAQPDAFVQMPPTQTRKIEKLRFMTEPLDAPMLIAGPIALTFYAEIDQDDTNWIVILKDLGPDVGVQTARPGELAVSSDLPERELTRGWLKASHRQLDEQRTKPWKPWHQLTREAQQPVVAGEINAYQVEILSTANLFEKGHRICVEITSMDTPATGFGYECEYIPYHVCSSKTVVHKVHHNASYPSHLLLPVIPD